MHLYDLLRKQIYLNKQVIHIKVHLISPSAIIFYEIYIHIKGFYETFFSKIHINIQILNLKIILQLIV